jgi:hypothetical protein
VGEGDVGEDDLLTRSRKPIEARRTDEAKNLEQTNLVIRKDCFQVKSNFITDI